MSGFFDIPEKDKTKGLNEALDLIENFLDDPDNSKLNRSFEINEPTVNMEQMISRKDQPLPKYKAIWSCSYSRKKR